MNEWEQYLHKQLEQLYHSTDLSVRQAADPIAFVHRYSDRQDREIAAFFAAGLAFGKVSLFFPILQRLFTAMDQAGGPYRFVQQAPTEITHALTGISYRWSRSEDLAVAAMGIGKVLKKSYSLENLFEPRVSIEVAMGSVVDALRTAMIEVAGVQEFQALSRGVKFFLTKPSDGSACKRWNLFFRWMVRDLDVDFGLWKRLTPADLVIPLDTHVARISRMIGLTQRSDNSWRTALEITSALRQFDPDDPIRYDFVIAHLGISGQCNGRFEPTICPDCILNSVCHIGSNSMSMNRMINKSL